MAFDESRPYVPVIAWRGTGSEWVSETTGKLDCEIEACSLDAALTLRGKQTADVVRHPANPRPRLVVTTEIAEGWVEDLLENTGQTDEQIAALTKVPVERVAEMRGAK